MTHRGEFIKEIRGLLSGPNLLIFLTFFLLVLVTFVGDVIDYKLYYRGIDNFQESERDKLGMYSIENPFLMLDYSLMGVEVLFVPSPASFLFGRKELAKFKGKADASIFIKTRYNMLSSSFLGIMSRSEFSHFVYFLYLIGTGLCTFFGYTTSKEKRLRRTDKYYSTILKAICVRVVFITLGILLLAAAIRVIGVIMEFPFTSEVIFMFNMLMFLVWSQFVFFYFMGLFIGTINFKNKNFGQTVLFGTWIILLSLVPLAIESFVSNKGSDFEHMNYDVKLEQYQIADEMIGKIENIKRNIDDETEQAKAYQQLISDFWENKYEEIGDLDKQLVAIMERQASADITAYALSPTSHFFTFMDEARRDSGKNYIEFYKYMLNIREIYFKALFEKLSKNSTNQFEKFFNSGENLFYGKSYFLPDYYLGFFLTLLYSLVLLAFSLLFFRFQRFQGETSSVSSSDDNIY